MKSECESIERHLIDDLGDALCIQDRVYLEDHLASCPDCRDLQEQMKKANEATSVLRRQREALTMPIGLTVAIKQQLAPRKPLFSRPVWRFATAMVLVVLLVAVAWIYQSIIPGSSQSMSMISGTGAAYSGRSASKSDGQGITNDAAISAGKAAAISGGQSVPAMSTAAATRNAGSESAVKLTLDAYILYSGSLADLKPLQDAAAQSSPAPVSKQNLLSALQESLMNAAAVRVLTNPDPVIKNVVILAGYNQVQAMIELARIRSSLNAGDSSVSIEVIDPGNPARLIDLFDQTRYYQLMPFASDRELTYLLIMIGG